MSKLRVAYSTIVRDMWDMLEDGMEWPEMENDIRNRYNLTDKQWAMAKKRFDEE